MPETTDVAIVGGGPAGAALAIHLAQRGIHAMLIERQAQPAWRACGVFSSPLTRDKLANLGLSSPAIDQMSQPIGGLELETVGGVRCLVTYENGHALGFSRPALDGVLLTRARNAGADVRSGRVVRAVRLGDHGPAGLTVSSEGQDRADSPLEINARVVVGADGSSVVAREAGVERRVRLLRKAGITFHRPDAATARDEQARHGRFLFGRGWYVGVAPVPGGLVNVGMVVPAGWLAERPEPLAARLLGAFQEPRPAWIEAPTTDGVRVAGTLGKRVERVAGNGWLLVGDACGFIDPLTGDGLQRAFATAELAADAVARSLRGDRDALTGYDRRVRAQFRGKNVISWMLQAFLSRPRALEYALARLARRHALRETLTLVLTDQLPASRALDPRFLARLLAP